MKKVLVLILLTVSVVLLPTQTGQNLREVLDQHISRILEKSPPYVRSSPKIEADCSGQMYWMYKQFGIPIPESDHKKALREILEKIRRLLDQERWRKSLV